MQGIVIQVMELLTNQIGGSTTTQKLTKAGSHSLCWRNKKKRKQYYQRPENGVTQKKLESWQPFGQELESQSLRSHSMQKIPQLLPSSYPSISHHSLLFPDPEGRKLCGSLRHKACWISFSEAQSRAEEGQGIDPDFSAQVSRSRIVIHSFIQIQNEHLLGSRRFSLGQT